MLQEVTIQKLVHGGQGLGQLADGKKIFVWNALPGEVVGVRVGRKKRDYAEGFAETILTASPDRIEPVDDAYLSTSPWQILNWDAENRYKQEILTESLQRAGVDTPTISFESATNESAKNEEPWLHYRNKMEYSFWGDDEGLHLALFHRASHGKRIITGSSIARPEIDEVANQVLSVLNQQGVRASQLKTMVLRVNATGDVVVALFVKDKFFPAMKELDGFAKGLAIYYSNPKSPASIITKKLYIFGDITLTDSFGSTQISYDVNSFFQVNLPVFEHALSEIKAAVKGQKKIIDMYGGVGTIGLCVGAQTLVEVDANNCAMAEANAKGTKTTVVSTSSEQALEYIQPNTCVIVDPPRAGLHEKVIDQILANKPKKLVYLSCNPATQARDLARLQSVYRITKLTGYNFFPRTPHIESLAILELA